jgi:hypothetical protein
MGTGIILRNYTPYCDDQNKCACVCLVGVSCSDNYMSTCGMRC